MKIPKFKWENDPNIYLEWEQKLDQIFNIDLVSDQEQLNHSSRVSKTTPPKTNSPKKTPNDLLNSS